MFHATELYGQNVRYSSPRGAVYPEVKKGEVVSDIQAIKANPAKPSATLCWTGGALFPLSPSQFSAMFCGEATGWRPGSSMI